MRMIAVAPGDRQVPWLGQCRSNWRFKPIKYLCALNARVLPESTDPDTEIRYIDIGSVNPDGDWKASEPMTFSNSPSRARRILSDDDVLISTVRTYLRAITHVGKINGNLVCSTGFAVLSAGKDVDPQFLAYWVRSACFVDEVVARSVGVSYPAINASDIGSLPFPVIPPDEQHAIAAFLDRETVRIDTLIAKKERQIELLQEKRAALISHVVTKGLNPNARMKDSGIEWLGEIPEHWEAIRFKFVLSEPLKYGANESGEYDEPSWPRYVRITDVNENGTLREETFKSLPEDVARPYLLQEGDLLFARSGATVGKTSLYLESWGRAAFAGYLIRARLRRASMLPAFAAYFCRSYNYWDWLRSSFIQATIQNVSAERYANMVVPMPPSSEQREITEQLDAKTSVIDRMTERISQSMKMLHEYRTALISAAVTGKIDVRKEVV
jgi:type I restriction enzyme S subunit